MDAPTRRFGLPRLSPRRERPFPGRRPGRHRDAGGDAAPRRPGLQGCRAARGARREQPPRRRHHQPPHRTLALQPLPRARPLQAGARSRVLRRADAAPGDFRGGPHRPHARPRIHPDHERAVPRDSRHGRRPHHRRDPQRSALLRRLCRLAAGRVAPGGRPGIVVRPRGRPRARVPQGSGKTLGRAAAPRAGGDRLGPRMKRSCWAPLVALLVLATAAYAQGSSRTLLLIARPGLPDPNFRETVVLVTQEEGAEATGVIINRPTNRSLADMLPSERFKPFKEPIFFGGPVAPQGLFAVFQADRFSGAAVTMLPGLYLAVVPDSIDALLNNPPPKIRFFSGYSGWAPGQLRAELDRGDWLVVDADAETLFLKDTSRLWQDMVRRARAVHADAAPRLAISSSR